MNKRKIGNDKEKLVVEYLISLGYEILETNFYFKTGEIDIIAIDEGYLCFIEVKYRNSLIKGYPEEAVDLKKIRHITRTAEAYMKLKRINDNVPCRFDVVSVLDAEVNVVRNAFEADWY